MLIAIPVENGKLCSHFGHCPHFALIETDAENRKIAKTNEIDAPPHEPGLLPAFLAEKGVTLVICGGIGARAIELFAQKGVNVVPGAPQEAPEKLVAAYLEGKLAPGSNRCDH